jgi:hypothetical protein
MILPGTTETKTRNSTLPISKRSTSLLWFALLSGSLGVLAIELYAWLHFIGGQAGSHGYLAQTDFMSWFAAAHMLVSGESDKLYNAAAHAATQSALIAPYSRSAGELIYHYWPVLAGLLLPVAAWPPESALAFWIIGGAVAFTGALVVLVRTLHFSRPDGLLFGAAAWSFLPHIWDLETGQTSNLLCLPLVLGVLALRRGMDGQAGFMLGLLFLKPQLGLIWMVALLAGRRWRALAAGTATVLALLGISTLLAGPGWIAGWLGLSGEVVGKSSGIGFDPIYSFNLKPILALIPGVGAAGANTLQVGVAVLLAAGIGWLWWRTPRTAPTSTYDHLIALTVLAMLLASPVLMSHDLTFWVIAAAFVLAPHPDRAPVIRRNWALLCWLGWLLPWPALTILFYSPIKLTTIYMLGMGILLLLSLPNFRRVLARVVMLA